MDDKQKIAEQILAEGGALNIVLSSFGATLPRRFQGRQRMGLAVGYNFSIPIPDLKTDQDGISGTLHFSPEGYVFCKIPWRCVYGLYNVDGHGKVWEAPPTWRLIANPNAQTSEKRGQLQLVC